ncbi:MAG: hypothetical protein ACQEXQ_27115 [Bacillota bacterium]
MMLTLLIAFFVSMISIAFIPILRKTLHPLEILSCGILIASLEQFSYAVLTVNLQLVKASEDPFKFFALKLEQIILAPIIILFGLFVLFSNSRRPLSKAIAFASTVILLCILQYLYHLSGTIQFVKWSWGYDWVKDAALLAISIGFLALLRKFLRWQEVSHDPVPSDSL